MISFPTYLHILNSFLISSGITPLIDIILSSSNTNSPIFSPYCQKVVYSEKTNWNECRHFVSVNDDYIEWDNGLTCVGEVCSIINNYYEFGYFDEMNTLLKGLKIGKYISIDGDWGYDSIEDVIESMTLEIFIERIEWDTDHPGGSGTDKILYIKDRRKIRWIIKEFNIFYQRLLEFDKNKEKLFNPSIP